MTDSDTKKLILEMIYGLLPEDQAEILRVRIEKEPDLQQLYDELSRKNRLITEAAKLEPVESVLGIMSKSKPGFEWKPVAEAVIKTSGSEPKFSPENKLPRPPIHAKMTQVVHASHPPRHGFRRITRELARKALGEERGVNRMVTICAICLVCFILTGLLFQKVQVGRLSQMSYHLRVATPGILTDGQPQVVQVQVTDLVGRPQQIPVRIAMKHLDGEKIFAKTEQTDSTGQLQLTLDSQVNLPPEVDLEISAGEKPDRKIISRLQTQQPPSQMVASREQQVPFIPLAEDSLTLKKSDNSLGYENGDRNRSPGYGGMNMSSDINRSGGMGGMSGGMSGTSSVVSSAKPPAAPFSGPSIESFAEPSDVSSSGDFEGGRTTFGMSLFSELSIAPMEAASAVPMDAAPMRQLATTQETSQKPMQATSRGTVAKSKQEPIVAESEEEPFEIQFYPEGGNFVVGLENRIYFRANREIHGKIVDREGNTLAQVESLIEGNGEFRLTPKAGEHYRLLVDDQEISMDLPQKDLPVVLGTGRTVFGAGESLVIHLQSKKNRYPVAITIAKQGVPVQTVMKVLDSGLNTLDIPLDSSVFGILDVVVFDGTRPKLDVLATQPVFRRPGRYLELKAKHKISTLSNGTRSWNFDVDVTDETGKPSVAAIVGVNVFQDLQNDDTSRELIRRQPTLADQVYFSSQSEFASSQSASSPSAMDWETINTLLNAENPESDAKLGILLATRLNTRLKCSPELLANLKPFLYDNLGELKSEYQQKISQFQNDQQSWAQVFVVTAVFGGMAFAVFVMILATMRLTSVLRMFVLTTIVGLCCMFLCMMMLQNQVTSAAVFELSPFTSWNMKAVTLDQKNGLTTPAEKTDSSEPVKELTKESAKDQQEKIACEALDSSEPPQLQPFQVPPSQVLPFRNIFRQPSLETDSHGRVSFHFTTGNEPSAPLYVIIDAATTDGRVGLLRLKF